jgi:uncharacterized membrane protein
MDPTVAIGLWAVLFVGSHLVISSDQVRSWLISRIREQPYRGVYSLVAFATLIPLVIVFSRHKHAGHLLWYLRDVEPVRWLAWILMLASLIFLVAGFSSPSPAAFGMPSVQPASAILKVTRHPTFVAFALFGFAHMLMNGWVGDFFFFGSFPTLGILGGIHQDRRKIREVGDTYRKFLAETSFFPGGALSSGRQQWSSADTPWTAIVIGVAATIAIVMFHPVVFGGSPLG